MNRDLLHQNFDAEYKKLNARQKEAVDKIDGPVMVIAGPGTGKTQILSVRIGKILMETDALPSNILCLTYTDAGVMAMRKRLLSLIGPDAYSVHIHSFHSFCNMVIQQYMHLFHKRELQPLSELEQVQCLVDVIDGFDDTNPLKRYKTDAYYEARNLKPLFSAIKREGWSVDFLQKKIDEYIDEIIPENFKNKIKARKGIYQLTQAGLDEIEKMKKLKAAVAAFPAYEQVLKEKQRYDFDDMIRWVINVFKSNPEVLAFYQEQYQYFLVDEYQDTSGSQNELVELLVSYWKDESPNLFVVGDDDQSIYRFQGANMENMLLLTRKYTDLVKVVLTDNYRSVQPILDAAHSLIGNNKERLVNQNQGLEKTLTAALHKNKNNKPTVWAANNETEENIIVTEAVKKLVDGGVQPGRIAVIYKEHKAGDELQKFFLLQGIPFYAKKSINLLNDVLVKKILSYVHYVAAEKRIPFSGEPFLFEILHFNFHRISPLRIASICNEVYENQRRNKISEPQSIRQYLSKLVGDHQTALFSGDEETDELIRVHKALETLIAETENLPLLQWFTRMFNDAGILAQVLSQPDKAWQMQLLNGFFDFVKDESRRNPDLDLEGLEKQISLLEENSIAVPLVQVSGNDRGVNLLTCHGSKGLEYEHVFFIGCYSTLWESKRKPSQGFKLPPNVFSKETPEEKEEELRRLFFVAATRAEQHLYLTYPRFNSEGKELEPSRFLSEMLPGLKTEPEKLNEDLLVKYATLRYGLVQQPELQKAEADYVEQLLKNFEMNVTALNNYLDCPLKFYYNTLVRVPSAYSEAAQFGSSMHAALNYYYIKMMENGRQYPAKEVLLNRFKWDIEDNRQVFTEENLKRYLSHGLNCLDQLHAAYFENKTDEFVRTEVALRGRIQDVPVKGFADKLQYSGNTITITDFKTGSLEKSKKRYEFVPFDHPKKPEGGNYWRQAVFYKLLFDKQDWKNKQLGGVEFLFIEPNAEKLFDRQVMHINPEHEAFVTRQIIETWEKIMQHDFYRGCGKPECDWCEFVKTHKLYSTLHEVEEEPDRTMEGPADF